MIEVTVDGNIFSFPDDWSVEKYDEWPLYKKLSGSPVLAAQGCDLVAIHDQNLYLIEAKDYTFPTGTRPPPFKELSHTVVRKCFHTLAGLVVEATTPTGSHEEFCRRAVGCTTILVSLSVELPTDKGQLFDQAATLVTIAGLLRRDCRVITTNKPLVVSNRYGTPLWSSRRHPAPQGT